MQKNECINDNNDINNASAKKNPINIAIKAKTKLLIINVKYICIKYKGIEYAIIPNIFFINGIICFFL